MLISKMELYDDEAFEHPPPRLPAMGIRAETATVFDFDRTELTRQLCLLCFEVVRTVRAEDLIGMSFSTALYLAHPAGFNLSSFINPMGGSNDSIARKTVDHVHTSPQGTFQCCSIDQISNCLGDFVREEFTAALDSGKLSQLLELMIDVINSCVSGFCLLCINLEVL